MFKQERCVRIVMKYLAVMLTLACVFSPAYVLAASSASQGAKCYSLKVNKTYTKYDITSDKKADRIRLKSAAYDDGIKLTVIVNGKTVLVKTKDNVNSLTLKLIRLKNKKPFLYISFLTANGYYNGGWVYKYKSGKMKCAFDTAALIEKYRKAQPNGFRYYALFDRAKGNTMIFKAGSFETIEGTYALKYKNGTLKL